MRCLILAVCLCFVCSASCVAEGKVGHPDIIEPGTTITVTWGDRYPLLEFDRITYYIGLYDKYHRGLVSQALHVYERKTSTKFDIPDSLRLYTEADFFYLHVSCTFFKNNEPVGAYEAESDLFRIQGVNNVAEPILPPDWIFHTSCSPFFAWSSTPNATEYQLQVARAKKLWFWQRDTTEKAFADSLLVFNDSTLTDTTHVVFDLAPNTGYNWRIRPKVGLWRTWFYGWFLTGETEVAADRIQTRLPLVEPGDFEEVWIRAMAVNSLGYVFAATDRGLYRSINNGEGWEVIAFMEKEVNTVAVSDKDVVFVGIGILHYDEGSVFYSTDDGLSWTDFSRDNSNHSFFNPRDIVCGPNNLLLATDENSLLYWSSDTGTPWEMESDIGAVGGGGSIAIDSSSELHLWRLSAGYTFNPVNRQWEKDDSQIGSDIEISPEGEIFISNHRGIFKRDPHSPEWTQLVETAYEYNHLYDSYDRILISPGGDVYTGKGRYVNNRWEKLWTTELEPYRSAVAMDRYGRVYSGSFNEIIRTLDPVDSMIAGVSPRNNSVLSTQSAKLTWPTSHYTNARYHVQVSQTPFPGKAVGGSSGALLQTPDLILDDESVVGAEKTVSGLTPGGTYFWRVATLANGKRGSWSPVYKFSVSASTSVLPGSNGNTHCRLFPQEGAIRVEAQTGFPSDVSFVLYDYLGREVSRFSRSAVYGTETMLWNIGDLAAGTYICKISIGNTIWTQVVPISQR